MMDLATVSDDDLAVEVARRGLHQRIGVFALMTASMLDYHAMWSRHCAWVGERMAEDGARYWPVEAHLRLVVDEAPPAYRAIGINTSFIGSEDRIADLARAA